MWEFIISLMKKENKRLYERKIKETHIVLFTHVSAMQDGTVFKSEYIR